MMTNALILLEGSYTYFQKDVSFSQEDFKLVHFPDISSYHIYSEVLSRTESGEFLKVIVRFEMNDHFIPNFLRIEKSLGNRYAQEVFKFDLNAQELKYSFQNTQNTQEFTRPLNAKHYLTSPAFATSTIFTLSKKFDATNRTPVALIGTSNEWNYENPPDQKVVFADFKIRDLSDFKLNNNNLSASHLCLYEFDTSSSKPEVPVEIFISKHYGIPYKLVQGDLKIVIQNLKKNS